jgi:hypothetical protein
MTALLISATVLCVAAWRDNRRNAQCAAIAHTEQYGRCLRFLSTVRDAHRCPIARPPNPATGARRLLRAHHEVVSTMDRRYPD